MAQASRRQFMFTTALTTLMLGGCVSRSQYDAAQAENQDLRQQVGRLQGAIRYTVNSDLLFPSGSWTMSADGKDIIARMASQLAPSQQNKIVVNGYTDNAPVGASLRRQGVTSNLILSQKRADAVMQFMISQGVRPELVSAQGHGEADPVAPNTTAEGRAKNRRVDLVPVEPVDPDPVGRISFSGGTIAAGIGFSWGSGTLLFRGKTYNFRADGFSLGDVGAARVDAAGGVYNLRRIEDFDGTYTAVDVGLTLAGGGSLVTMRNPHGVVIQARSTTAGLRINLGAAGVTITMQ
jgi:chemotaxis protein MotB